MECYYWTSIFRSNKWRKFDKLKDWARASPNGELYHTGETSIISVNQIYNYHLSRAKERYDKIWLSYKQKRIMPGIWQTRPNYFRENYNSSASFLTAIATDGLNRSLSTGRSKCKLDKLRWINIRRYRFNRTICFQYRRSLYLFRVFMMFVLLLCM